MLGLDRLLAILPQIRATTDVEALDSYRSQADAILLEVLGDFGEGNLDSSAIAAYRLVFDQVSRAVVEAKIRAAAVQI